VGVQEVRWDEGGTEPTDDYTSSMEMGMLMITWGQAFFVHKRIMTAVKRVEFVSDRMSCIILSGRWCDIIVLNMHQTKINVMIQRTTFIRN
jgi:hypothetical protein